MEVSKYNQMMSYLTRPRESFRNGGRIGFANGGRGVTKGLGGGLYEVTYKGGSKTYYTKIYDRETGKDIKNFFGSDKKAAVKSLKKQKADRPKTKFEKLKEVKETKGTKEFKKITDKIDKKFNKVKNKGYTNLTEFRKEMQELVTKDKFRNQIEIQKKLNGYITDKFKDVENVNTSNMESALDKYNKVGGKERGTIDKIANEFGINKNTFVQTITKTGRKTIPIKYGSEYEKSKAVSEKRSKAEKKFSDPSFESKMSGTDAVQKSHMDDLYSKVVTAETLGYAPKYINQEVLKDADAYLNALYKKRDKLIKNKPAGYKKAIEEINEKGIKVASATKGYKSFQIMQPDGSTYQFGVDAGKTIDPTGITEGKQIKDNVEKVKFEGGKKPTATLTPDPVDQYFFEENRKAVMEAQSKVTKNEMKSIANSLAALGCPGKAMGGRIEFQAGGTPTRECILAGANKINNPSLIKGGAEARNATQFLNKAFKLGRTVAKFAVVPEAIFVAAESVYRLTRGEGLSESLLRATDYLNPFADQTRKADFLKYKETVGEENANTILKARDYKKSLEQLNTAKSNLETNQMVLDDNPFGYTATIDSRKQLEIDKQFIKAAEQNVKNKFQPEPVMDFAARKKMEAEDIRGTRDPFYKAMVNARSVETDDFETLFTPEKKQEGVAPPMMTLDDLAMRFVPDEFLEAERAKIGDAPELTKRNILDFYRDKEAPDGSRPINELIFSELFKDARSSPANQERFFGTRGLPFGEPITGGTNIPTNRFADFKLGMAGGGIAKLAGVDSGPPPEKGPTPQGLDFLLKRGR